MISCTEFIPAYSELFCYLDELGGKAKVIEFWEDLSDRFLGNLAEAVDQYGMAGCWRYWSRTLNEEAADFVMRYDDEQEIFTIDMRHCPSKGRLLELEHFQAYPDYCQHCDVLYRRVLEPRGYHYTYDQTGCPQAQCSLTVTRSDLSVAGSEQQT